MFIFLTFEARKARAGNDYMAMLVSRGKWHGYSDRLGV